MVVIIRLYKIPRNAVWIWFKLYQFNYSRFKRQYFLSTMPRICRVANYRHDIDFKRDHIVGMKESGFSFRDFEKLPVE